jgi:hypothetical protein
MAADGRAGETNLRLGAETPAFASPRMISASMMTGRTPGAGAWGLPAAQSCARRRSSSDGSSSDTASA